MTDRKLRDIFDARPSNAASVRGEVDSRWKIDGRELINARPSNLILVLEKGVPQFKIVRLEPKAAGRLAEMRMRTVEGLLNATP